MRVLGFLAVLVACSYAQTPHFVSQFEARFTEVFDRKVNGVWIQEIEVGSEYRNFKSNYSRYEVVRYVNVDGRQVAIPEERVHHPTRSYHLYNDNNGAFQCRYHNPNPPPNPPSLTWKYMGTTFVQPTARNDEETIWGTHTSDVYEATMTDPQQRTVTLTYLEDSFSHRPLVFGVDNHVDYRAFRVYRDFFERTPNTFEFAIPSYFKCVAGP